MNQKALSERENLPEGLKKMSEQHVVSAGLILQNCQEFAFPEGKTHHEKPSDALFDVFCEPVRTDLVACGHMFKWKCILGKCGDCKDKMQTHPQEQSHSLVDTIHFFVYLKTTRCSKHGELKGNPSMCNDCEMEVQGGKKKGKVSAKREKWKANCPVGTFMNSHHIPLLDIFKFHWPHLKMTQQDNKEQKMCFGIDTRSLMTL